MNFEKKYWSAGEFSDNNGTGYEGYVGIFEGKAYNYNTEEELIANDKYICRINCSDDNFDRVLSNELRLPYGKKDVTFAANDFLYSGTLKTAIERLEANNNYIFKNSIISNSTIPDTDYCTIFASTGDIENIGAQGILKPFDFSSSAFSGKTAKDPFFYPQSETKTKFISKDNLGKAQDVLSETTAFIETPEEIKNTSKNKFIITRSNHTLFPNASNRKIYAYEVWERLYGGGYQKYDNVRLSSFIDTFVVRVTTQTNQTITVSDSIDKTEYFYSMLPSFDKSTTDLTDANFISSNNNIVHLKTKELQSLLENSIYTKPHETANLKIKTLYFIASLNDVSSIPSLSIKYMVNADAEEEKDQYAELSDIEGLAVTKYKVDTSEMSYTILKANRNVFLIKYDFTTPLDLGSEIFKYRYETTEEGAETPTYASAVDITGPKFMVSLSGVKGVLSCDSNIFFDCRYTIGSITYSARDYKEVPQVTRVNNHGFVWKPNPNESTIKIAPSTWTYKHLIESPDWLNAPQPKIEYATVSGNNELATYIPGENMTANDVFDYLSNSITSYYKVPDLNLNSQYTFSNKLIYVANTTERVKYIKNNFYKPKSYIIDSYKLSKGKLQRSYKLPEEVHADLYKFNTAGDAYKPVDYDYIPSIEQVNYVEMQSEDLLKHNFNEITASNILIESATDGEAKVLLFIAFKDKILIIPTTFYYENGEMNFNLPALDLSNSQNYIELKYVNPRDTSSIKFLNINAIKIYKKMMYVIDNELNMVLRYDIDLLSSQNSKSEFSIRNIKLIDILQGKGKSTDKIYFNNPYSIDVNDNRAYIVDRGNNCVKVYTPGLNYIKTLKNGFFSSHDIQAVAINPHSCIIKGEKIPAESLWIVSTVNKRIYISVLSDDKVVAYGQIDNISLISDKYSWVEEVRGINFSFANSSYFYLNTNKRVYKFHTSQPFYPFASLNYFKQRSIVSTMKWGKLNYPWHNIPSVYGAVSEDDTEENQVIWSYNPPPVSAEILDNKCFTLSGCNEFEGDIIFHYGILYDNSKIQEYIKENNESFGGEMTFKDIDLGMLTKMIKSAALLLYKENDSYISSLSNNEIVAYNTYKFTEQIEEDYINPLTFNKMLYSVVYNLLKIKNTLYGHFKAATNFDNVIVYDNLVLDNYFNNLSQGPDANYFIHDNEVTSIIVNRTLESIYDLQEKIINRMQTAFMATQSYVNNTSRII